MAETQSYPPPPVLDFTSRRLPQPVQLPPLAIPPHGSPRSDYQRSPPLSQSLPSIHSVQAPPPPPRSQPRSYSGPAAPLDKLLSPHPYTPPRSDSGYSPHNSPPRPNVEVRPPPRKPYEKYDKYEDARSHHHEPYPAPVEPHRSSYGSIPSPISSYPPSYSQTSHYRSSGPPAASAAPLAQQPYIVSYSEPPPPRIAPPAPPPPPPPPPLDMSYVPLSLVS
jgi:hypothetical protein